MNYQLLRNKRLVENKNGELEYDLFDQTYSNDVRIKIIDTFEVTEFYAMRFDKVAAKFYKNRPDLGNALALFNEYENMFSLDVGDILLIPEQEALERNFVKDNSNNTFEVEQTTPVIQSRKKDVNRENFLRKKDLLLPPTFAGEQVKKKNSDGTITLAK